MKWKSGVLAGILTFALTGASQAEDQDLAKKLSNPLASLISVPFQFNYDTGFTSPNGERTTLNIQPVVPVAITPDTNLIIRTIVPYK